MTVSRSIQTAPATETDSTSLYRVLRLLRGAARALLGKILPPLKSGHFWDLDAGEFVADVFKFDFRTRTLTLEALTNPRLASAEEIYASLWTNPPSGGTPTWVNRERIELGESRRE